MAPLDNAAGFTVGALLAVAGIVLCIAAQLTMGDSWRIGVDQAETTQLVTSGVFASVRNPIFSAMALAAAGFALLLANLWALATLVALLVGLELQVRLVEEPSLRRTPRRTYNRKSSSSGRSVSVMVD